MILNKNKPNRDGWNPWFAWFPVPIWNIDHTEIAWLEWVEKIKAPGGGLLFRTKEMAENQCGQ